MCFSLQRCTWTGNGCSDFFNFSTKNDEKSSNTLDLLGFRHFISSVQEKVHRFIDFLMVRGVTA